jgi:hypothetical protein
MTTSIARPPAPGAAAAVEEIPGLAPGRDLRAVGALRVRGAVDRSCVEAAGSLTVEGRAGAALLTSGADMTLSGAHCCGIRAGGSLRFLGRGASDCDIEAEEDLVALTAGSAIRSGLVRVGGRLWAHELAGREGARLRVILTGGSADGDLLRADVVRPGVEVVVCGELLRFDRLHAGVRIQAEDGRAAVSSA